MLYRSASRHVAGDLQRSIVDLVRGCLRVHRDEEKQMAVEAAVACEIILVLSHLATPGGTQLPGRRYVFSPAQHSFLQFYWRNSHRIMDSTWLQHLPG